MEPNLARTISQQMLLDDLAKQQARQPGVTPITQGGAPGYPVSMPATGRPAANYGMVPGPASPYGGPYGQDAGLSVQAQGFALPPDPQSQGFGLPSGPHPEFGNVVPRGAQEVGGGGQDGVRVFQGQDGGYTFVRDHSLQDVNRAGENREGQNMADAEYNTSLYEASQGRDPNGW